MKSRWKKFKENNVTLGSDMVVIFFSAIYVHLSGLQRA